LPRAQTKRVSLRALAARLGVSEAAIRKGIKSGRLRKSVRRDARGPFVADVALARREWAVGATKPANAGNGGGRRRAQRAARIAVPPQPEHAPAPAPSQPVGPEDGTLVHAQLRVADQRARALELANKRRSGELHDVGECDRKYFEIARMLRERVLNVADRLADLGPTVRTRVREELRSALGSLADDLDE
jgi:hypothetical protein